MKARRGDRIVIRSRSVGTPDRGGVIVATRSDGGTPFEVQWDGSDHTALVFPGPDATIIPAPAASTSAL